MSTDVPSASPAPPPKGGLSKLSRSADAAETVEKYRRYTMEYVQRLNHKYFSDQNINSIGPLFESSTKVDEFEIKESKDSPLEKLQNLRCYIEDQIDSGTSVAEASPICTAKKKQPKKSQEGQS